MHDKHTSITDELKDTDCAECGKSDDIFRISHNNGCSRRVECSECGVEEQHNDDGGFFNHVITCSQRAKPKGAGMNYFDAHTEDMTLEGAFAPIDAVLRRSDGEPLLYAGCLSSIHGLPNAGKSWLGLLAAQSAIAGGGRVIWLDFESSKESLARRAQAIGFSEVLDNTRFRFVRPSLYTNTIAIVQSAQWLKQASGPGLVVLDSVTSAGCPSDGADVQGWFKEHVEPFSLRSIAMLLIDHIPKRSNDRPAGAIGSQHKLAILNGVSIKVSGKPWTARTGGKITLTLEKDREGQLPAQAGEMVAVVSGEWHDGVLRCAIDAPDGAESAAPVRDRVLSILRDNEEGILGQRPLRELARCDTKALGKALRELVDAEAIVAVKEGKALRYMAVGKD